MEAMVRNISKTHSEGVQLFRYAGPALWVGMSGVLGLQGDEQPILHYTLTMLQELVTGQLIFEDMDALRQSAQLLHFILDIMF